MIEEISFERISEGKYVQIMHVGPYSTELESLSKMRKLMEKRNPGENRFIISGKLTW
ncbi:MAG: hypothetical protein ACUVQY_08415 [Thermoproteota archaeon]